MSPCSRSRIWIVAGNRRAATTRATRTTARRAAGSTARPTYPSRPRPMTTRTRSTSCPSLSWSRSTSGACSTRPRSTRSPTTAWSAIRPWSRRSTRRAPRTWSRMRTRSCYSPGGIAITVRRTRVTIQQTPKPRAIASRWRVSRRRTLWPAITLIIWQCRTILETAMRIIRICRIYSINLSLRLRAPGPSSTAARRARTFFFVIQTYIILISEEKNLFLIYFFSQNYNFVNIGLFVSFFSTCLALYSFFSIKKISHIIFFLI